MKHWIFIYIIFIGFGLKAQEFKPIKTIKSHKMFINTISASNKYFATGSLDRNLFVYNYKGKRIFKYKNRDAAMGEVILHPDSSYLFLSITEVKDHGYERPIIKCFDLETGEEVREFIDTTMTQQQINTIYEKNTKGARNAISHLNKTLPDFQMNMDINIPRVKDGLSHIDRIQSISVSNDYNRVASMDKYNLLKIWDTRGRILSTFRVNNNKLNTDLYFVNDTTLLITPNILLNMNDYSFRVLSGYQNYKRSIPVAEKIFYFTNIENSKLADYSNDSKKTINVMDSKCYRATYSKDKFAFLGIDGLVRICDFNGRIIQKLGRDRTKVVSTRYGSRAIFSEIEEIKLSPNGEYLITSDKYGKTIIWKLE